MICISGEQINFWPKPNDLRDTDKSRYFLITEFNNCLIIRSFTKACFQLRMSGILFVAKIHRMIKSIIIHQTHYEKSDWSRAFNQFTIACELDMINVISAADITFIMSSSTSAWLLSPLECSPQKQNG